MAGFQFFKAAVTFLLVICSKQWLAASKSSGFRLRLIPRDSPESPLYSGKLTRFERIERWVNISRAKAELMRLRSSSPNTTFDDEKYLTPSQLQIYYYVAEIKIGDPLQTVYLAVDTGSGLIWTQCQPCIHCFQQRNPIYNPRTSASYQSLSCDHPRCNHDEPSSPFECVNGRCTYSYYYAGGVTGPTNGVASMESFEFLTDTDGDSEEFNVLFGCSNENRNFRYFDFPGNRISGILGLNLDPESLFTQLSEFIDATFSYCFVPFTEQDTRLVLRFGDHVFIPPGDIPTTHYFTFSDTGFYYLNCLDISIGIYRLGLQAGTFDPSGNSGFIIDSGAPVTMLTTQALNGVNVYERLMGELMGYFEYHRFVRVTEQQNPWGLQVCYWNPRGSPILPSLTFHFAEADYVLDKDYAFLHLEGEGMFCIPILGVTGPSFLGAVHMRNMRIIHNGDINAIQFYPEDCTRDHM